MAIGANVIVNKAISQIGVKESPSGSNNVKYNTAYYGKAVRGGNYAWCCTFVWWLFRECGASSLFYKGKKVAYCPAVGDWAIANKLTVSKTAGKPGDIVLFDWNKNGSSDHIGIIEKNLGGGKYQTIEGNTSLTSNDNGGKVMRRTRNTSYINLIVRPKYGASKPEVVPAYPSGTLSKGSYGVQVKALQNCLNKLMGAKLTVDGEFGNGTFKAVKAFQKKYKLTADGVAGTKTNAKIKALLTATP